MERDITNTFAGILSAASFACMTQILTLDKFSCPLKIAVFIFAISIPLDVYMFVCQFPADGKFKIPCPWSKFVYWACFALFIPISLLGYVAVFWHFSKLHGIAFLASAALSYILFAWRSDDLRKGKG